MLARWHGDLRATPIVLTADERTTLQGWVRSGVIEHRLVERARVVPLAAAGMASRRVAREVGCARGVVSKWRVRFARDRLAGLADAPRPGKPKTYDAAVDRRILAALDRPPPAGFARWTAPLLARESGDVSDQHIWRFLRAQRIDLAGRRSWCLSSDPEFVAKAADIVGLYLAPPDHAIVLASTRSRRARRSSGRRAISSCPTAARATARRTSTGAAAPPPCSRRSRSPPARSRPSPPGAGGAPSSSTS